jgi:hypothetical protein
VKRRERTRQLIELGGLIAKAGIVELTEDNRTAIFGALLEVAAKLQGAKREAFLVLWLRRGQKGFRNREP